KSSIILTALMMACSVTACQGASISGGRSVFEDMDVTTQDAPETPASTETETEMSSEELEELDQELYNNYIAINNFMLGRLDSSLERYFNYVDIEQMEFTLLDEDDDYFDCYSLSEYNIEDVENTYEMANSKSDKSELDEAYLKLYPSLSLVIETLNDIEVYTDMKSYLDDDYQKAQEYHTVLMNSLVEYIDTGDAFMAELDIVAKEHQEIAYAQMLEQGYEVLYTMNMVIDVANEIENELYEQDVWDENILDMDLEKIQPLYDEFVANVDALLAYDGDEEKLAAEGISKYGWWSSFIRDLKETKVSLTEVLQKVKEGEELSSFDIGSSFAGHCSLSSFDAGLSSLINDYNNMINVG
ncbi:MAG: YiiG family protein, partial [Lachnospiraceae bacterium]|nr:YiiG family protein [Lachnospiraceae bacterium]